MRLRLPIALLVFIPFASPVQAASAHIFYRHWDSEAKTACAKAIRRIVAPYRVQTSPLVLLEESSPDGGDFHELGMSSADPETLADLTEDFPSLKNSPSFVKALSALAVGETIPLSPYLPAIVRNPILLRRPTLDDEYTANCFGAALGWFGYSNQWLSNDSAQLERILDEHFKKVPRRGYLKPETLVVWRFASDRSAFHAAILFPKEIVWQRRGSNPAAFTTFGRAINAYGGRNGGSRDAIIEFYQHIP